MKSLKNKYPRSGTVRPRLFKYTTVVFIMLLFFSCASVRIEKEPPPVQPPVKPPVKPLEPSFFIMGNGGMTAEDLAGFLIQNNPEINGEYAYLLAHIYIEESRLEGVNHDVAFIQMCLETGFQRYGGLVDPDQNNFCGLGAIGAGKPGEFFPTIRLGIRAHIQHLKAYATEEGVVGVLVDPRYKWVKKGSAPTIFQLAGTWAADPDYGDKLKSLLTRLYGV